MPCQAREEALAPGGGVLIIPQVTGMAVELPRANAEWMSQGEVGPAGITVSSLC